MVYLMFIFFLVVSFFVVLLEFLIKDNFWYVWKEFYEKKYEFDDEEYLCYIIWIENFKYINKYNVEGSSKFRFEMNYLGDMVCKNLF